jgi:hypothetical protein
MPIMDHRGLSGLTQDQLKNIDTEKYYKYLGVTISCRGNIEIKKQPIKTRSAYLTAKLKYHV